MSIEIVERELISGSIGPVDYGPELYCIARTPELLLCWSSGYTTMSGRDAVYASSNLIIIFRNDNRKMWERLNVEGGRFSKKTIPSIKNKLLTWFSEKEVETIIQAAEKRKTAVIDGGGVRLCPARKLGQEAFDKWRKEVYG